MKCKKCDSKRLATIMGKCDDRFQMFLFESAKDYHSDYPPDIPNLLHHSGEIDFIICLDCGALPNVEFPIPKLAIEEVEDNED